MSLLSHRYPIVGSLFSILFLFIANNNLTQLCSQVSAVNLDRYDKLQKHELLDLDRKVSRYYLNKLELLDDQNVSYDQSLYDSIQAIRHTVVLNLYDHMYTDDEIMRKSQGASVNHFRCKQELTLLAQMSQDMLEARSNELDIVHEIVPISAINMFESYGRSEPGVLNGNFVWHGSASSCENALIKKSSIDRYIQKRSVSGNALNFRSGDLNEIKGRYCMAHLKAKSWPKEDKYFGERVSLKVGVCIPESCHSELYFKDKEVREQIDYLGRVNLVSPFNGKRYHINYLFCFPDEDSDFRKWDLGTKLFIVFVTFWSLLLIYTNYKHCKRVDMMQKLDEYDIRMLITQNKRASASNIQTDKHANESSDEEPRGRPVSKHPPFKQKIQPPKEDLNVESTTVAKEDNLSKLVNSLSVPFNSVNPSRSPSPSDLDENDGEFNVMRPIMIDRKRHQSKTTNSGPKIAQSSTISQQQQQKQFDTINSQSFDLIQAFSVAANLDFLFGQTKNSNKEQRHLQSSSYVNQGESSISNEDMRRLSHQLSAINKRTSESNEMLLSKQYENQQETETEWTDPKSSQDQSINKMVKSRRKRVNVDVLDGIKVFATTYIVCGHTMMFFFGSATDIRFGDKRMFDFTMAALINSLQVVGLFYIITGAILTYLSFTRMKPKQLMRPSIWILVIIGRYVRLLPSYLLVFWFARHVAPFTGSGHLWQDYRTDNEHNRGYCATESWMTMLTISAADVKIPLDCVPQTWYLSNDFRTLLVLPFYVIILALNRTGGYLAILATIVVSAIKQINILNAANIDYKILLHWQPHVYSLMADRLHDVYTDLTVRLSTYLLGVVVGHLLYLYETRQIRDWPRLFRLIGIKWAILTGYLFFIGAMLLANPYVNQFLPSRDQVDSRQAVILIPMFKIMMEVCMCVVILLMVTGGGFKWLTNLMSSRAFQILSKISYGVFLVHVEVMYKMPSMKFEAHWCYLLVYCSFFVVTSNAIAFIMYVLYEMPINNMMRDLLKQILKTISD